MKKRAEAWLIIETKPIEPDDKEMHRRTDECTQPESCDVGSRRLLGGRAETVPHCCNRSDS